MKSVRAVWRDTVIAESDDTVQVEGNYYFPKNSINFKYLKSSELTTNCPWKGIASYHTLTVDGEESVDAAWSYPNPSREALQLKDHYAFWKEVEIVKETLEEKNRAIATSIRKYHADAVGVDQNDDGKVVDAFRGFMADLEEDALIQTLPSNFVNNLSFFNFYNSNNACFQTDRNRIIQRVNRTFSWAFNHLPDLVGKSFEELIEQIHIVEGDEPTQFFKTIESHGWAKLPIIRTEKDGAEVYYSLAAAITKHGDVEDLAGFQCQLTNITREVELSHSVERSKANMKSLLEGIDEGLFYFDRSGNVAEERSAALAKILPGSESFDSIQDISAKFAMKKKEDIDACLDLLWPEDDFMSIFEISVSMLPSKFDIEENGITKNIAFSYKQLNDASGNLDKVIVVVKDMTEILRSQSEANLQAERVKKISNAAANTGSYLAFTEEGEVLVSRISEEFKKSADQIDRKQLKRDLHTLKGMVSIFEYSLLTANIHSLEDMVSDSPCTEEFKVCSTKWETCQVQWKDETADIEQALGLKKNKNKISVNKDKMNDLIKFAKESQNGDLIDLCESMTRYDASIVFSKYVSYIDKLVQKKDDKEASLVFDPQSDQLNFEEVKLIDGALVHILRNCLDHGIESVETRKSFQKKAVGTITVLFKRESNGFLHFHIYDDGGGINGDKLAEKAVESGKWTSEHAKVASHHEKINLIFMANLSSKDEVTDVSGRGVGMDAVLEIITQLGGTILVKSETGVGTQFLIDIPAMS